MSINVIVPALLCLSLIGVGIRILANRSSLVPGKRHWLVGVHSVGAGLAIVCFLLFAHRQQELSAGEAQNRIHQLENEITTLEERLNEQLLESADLAARNYALRTRTGK